MKTILKSNIDLKTIEVLVCDDGSKKSLIHVVKKYENKLNIRYFYQPDKGFRVAASRNMGILNAKGTICIFLDSGVMPGTGCIAAHIQAHETKNTAVIGYVYGFDNENKKKDDILKLLDVSDIDSSIERLKDAEILDLRESVYHEMGDDLTKWPAPWCFFWSCNISVKRLDLIQYALFDESFVEWGGEDLDLGLALRMNHFNFVLRRDESAIHYPHPKRNKLDEDSEVFIQNLLNTRKKLYEKYKIPEILVWIKVVDTRCFNRYLLEHLEEWRN